MGVDIHVLAEGFNEQGNNWEIIKGDISFEMEELKKELEAVQQDEERNFAATFNGDKESIEQEMQNVAESILWIDPDPDRFFYALLSNVGNENLFPYAFRNSRRSFSVEANEMSDEAKYYMSYMDLFAKTILKGDDISALYNIIAKNYDEGYMEDSEYIRFNNAVKTSFEKNVERIKSKGYKAANIRFLIAYDN